MRKAIIMGLLLFLTGMVAAQDTLNNDSIIKLSQAGFSEDLIISTISGSPGSYDTSVDGLIALKAAGVSEKVLAAILARGAVRAGVVVAAPAANTVAGSGSNAPAGLPPGVDTVGIFYKDQNGGWQQMGVETISFTVSGGRDDHVMGVGVSTTINSVRDLNGTIRGTQSKLSLRTPAEFIIYLPEGRTPDEYILMRMRETRGNREYQGGGGSFFSMIRNRGANRALVEYTSERIAPRAYAITLNRDIGEGEYGFLPEFEFKIGNFGADGLANSGRVYSFSLNK